jgi:hypothetical protein
MPGDSGATVVTTLCLLPMHRGCGCIGHPAFPTPSIGRKIFQRPGRIAPRGRKAVSGPPSLRGAKRRLVRRSYERRRKQSILSLRGEMDCFASLAMTGRAHSRDPLARNDGQNCLGCLKIESVAIGPLANLARSARSSRTYRYHRHRYAGGPRSRLR